MSGSFLEVSMDQDGHPFGYVSFLWASIYFDYQSVEYGKEFLKPVSNV